MQEERFQCSFSLCGCSHRPLKPASWCLWYFLPSSKRWEEVKGLYKNDCLYYRWQSARRDTDRSPFSQAGHDPCPILNLFLSFRKNPVWIHFCVYKQWALSWTNDSYKTWYFKNTSNRIPCAKIKIKIPWWVTQKLKKEVFPILLGQIVDPDTVLYSAAW